MVRPLMRLSLVPAFLGLGAALALSACKSPCRELAEKLCDCTLTTLQRQQCMNSVSQADQRVNQTPEEDRVCATLLPGCDCRLLESSDPVVKQQGKERCGLANPTPQRGAP